MKNYLTMLAMALSFVLFGSLNNRTSAQVNVGVNVTYQTFYDELSPYGNWMEYPDYGYVWMPDAGPDFQPYSTNGHWVWTDEYEWMWVSDYNWGWAPFHYGRWMHDAAYGWMWVPGYEWSPAWVAWRDGGDYYGWAPLRPGFNISIGFSNYNPPIDYWCFTPRRYIASPRLYNYCAPRGNNITIINNTTIINNYNRRSNVFVSGGPRRIDAERYAGRIRPARFRESDRPGRTTFRRNEVSVYRPAVQRDNGRSFRPSNFRTYDRNNANNNNNNGRDRFNRNDRISNNNDRGNDRNNDRGNRFDRRTNNNDQTTGNTTDRPQRRFEPRTNTNPNTDNPNSDRGRNRRFERNRENVNTNPRPETRPEVTRPNTDNPNRRNVFDRPNRSDNTPNPSRNFERRTENRQPEMNTRPQRNFDRGNREFRSNPEPQRQSMPRMERRQEPSPQQPRFENRSRGGNEQGGGGGGARRFGRGG